MSDGSVGLAPDGTGKKVDVSELTVAGLVVERQRVVAADPTDPLGLGAVKDTPPAGTEYAPVTRPIVSALPLPANAAQEAGGNLAAIAASVDAIPAMGPAAKAASMPVTLATDQPAIPVSAAALPLPTGAAQEAGGNLAAIASSVAHLPAPGPAAKATSMPVTLATDQPAVPVSAAALPLPTGAAQEVGGNLATIAAHTPALGQALSAASSPVVLASDQAAVPVSGSVAVSGTVATNDLDAVVLQTETIAATGPRGWISTSGWDSIVIQVQGAGIPAVTVEGSSDQSAGSPVTLQFMRLDDLTTSDTITDTSIFIVKVSALYLRLNVLGLVGGSITTNLMGRCVVGDYGADRLTLALDQKSGVSLSTVPGVPGQAKSAFSAPVVLASDQSAIPVTFPVAQAVTLAALPALATGAATIGIVNQGTPATLANAWSFKVTDAVNGPAAVKAAAVAAAAADPALVVALSPNSPAKLQALDASGVLRNLSALNNASPLGLTGLATRDVGMAEGQDLHGLLLQMLIEQKITNQLLYELPTLLQSAQAATLNDPAEYRADPTLFPL